MSKKNADRTIQEIFFQKGLSLLHKTTSSDDPWYWSSLKIQSPPDHLVSLAAGSSLDRATLNRTIHASREKPASRMYRLDLKAHSVWLTWIGPDDSATTIIIVHCFLRAIRSHR